MAVIARAAPLPADPLLPRRALISVSDKTGIVELARTLVAAGVTLLSTGGSAAALRTAGLAVTDVSEVTGFPEILDGRVKTLHPAVHGGILGRHTLPEDQAALAAHAIAPIDLVIVNLYPFAATVASGADRDACVENIDIGGPALIRAAAKNHPFTAIITSPEQYPALVASLAAGGSSIAQRRAWAAAAFAHTAAYDGMIAAWAATALACTEGETAAAPERLVRVGSLRQALRYGENPHQSAALYLDGSARAGVATARQLQGKELSYNNIGDTDAAYELVAEFDQPAVVIVKHGNPCGVAQARGAEESDLSAIWRKALACDPVSAFGGIVAVNRPLTAALAAELTKLFLEVVIAPEVEAQAAAIFAAKQNVRVLTAGSLPDPAAAGRTIRSVAGGLLVQDRDAGRIGAGDLKVVTKLAPTPSQIADLVFAFRVAKHVKSNAIVMARDSATVGVGAGQMSRVDSARIAAWKAEEAGKAAGLAHSPAIGSVVASDAFFPFADGLHAAVSAGATAVIQPGGSMRDQEVIDAANELGVAMVMTGMRHFRH